MAEADFTRRVIQGLKGLQKVPVRFPVFGNVRVGLHIVADFWYNSRSALKDEADAAENRERSKPNRKSNGNSQV